jgi:hypothetical protein
MLSVAVDFANSPPASGQMAVKSCSALNCQKFNSL